MTSKFCKFCENRVVRDTPLRGVYIPHFGQIWVKISVFGVLQPCRCTDGGDIWYGGGTTSPCQISPPSVQRVDSVGRKTSKWASEKIKYRRLALRAMLPVNIMACPLLWAAINNKRIVNELWSGWDEQSSQFLVCNCFPCCMFRTVYDTESSRSYFLHVRQLTVPYLRHVQLQRQTVTQLNSSSLIPVSRVAASGNLPVSYVLTGNLPVTYHQ